MKTISMIEIWINGILGRCAKELNLRDGNCWRGEDKQEETKKERRERKLYK